ncbi:MAG: hypothetical protein IEMM0008_0738 [bacterium]|nr:MAG: hypothetical protein IEMM0008_0738 [bacterium]
MLKLVLLVQSVLMILLIHQTSLFSQTRNNPEVTSKGITFIYHNNHAKTVYLKSSFDHWKLKYPFKKKISRRGLWDGTWELVLDVKYKNFQLKSGLYTYKFLIDGEFISDPLNLHSMKDKMDNSISYFRLNKDLINYNVQANPTPIPGRKYFYRFIYKSSKAKKVNLVGNFNHWNAFSLPMTYIEDGIWEIKIKLSTGKYYYNFIADDKWTKDPLNTNVTRANSYYKVKVGANDEDYIWKLAVRAYSFFEVKADSTP